MNITPGRDIKTVEAPGRRLERVFPSHRVAMSKCRARNEKMSGRDPPPPEHLPSDNPRLCSSARRQTALLGLLPLRSKKIFNAILYKMWSSACTGYLRTATLTEDYQAGRITTLLQCEMQLVPRQRRLMEIVSLTQGINNSLFSLRITYNRMQCECIKAIFPQSPPTLHELQ